MHAEKQTILADKHEHLMADASGGVGDEVTAGP